jgi:hypothetical protein
LISPQLALNFNSYYIYLYTLLEVSVCLSTQLNITPIPWNQFIIKILVSCFLSGYRSQRKNTTSWNCFNKWGIIFVGINSLWAGYWILVEKAGSSRYGDSWSTTKQFLFNEFSKFLMRLASPQYQRLEWGAGMERVSFRYIATMKGPSKLRVCLRGRYLKIPKFQNSGCAVLFLDLKLIDKGISRFF